MKRLKVIFDTSQNAFIDAQGVTVQAFRPSIRYKENQVLQLVLINGGTITDEVATNPCDLLTDVSYFTASIDNDFNQSTPLAIKAEKEAINIAGDWNAFDGTAGNADPSEGQVSIRLSAIRSVLRDRLASSKKLKDVTMLELIAYASDDTVTAVYAIRFDVFNLQDQGSTPPDDSTDEFWTAIESDARFVKKIGLAGESITLVSPDGTKAGTLSWDDAGELKVDSNDSYGGS